jgi:2-(1,2-epoxy-1,2-dihydrophenyl)acetyl-CoA isomerase
LLESGFNPVLRQLLDLPCPFISVVNGAAAGGGCGYALAADVVIAARSAYFLQPFAAIGLVPDVGATWLLPRLAGRARATGMMMLGERISAETALDWGLIWQVVDDDRLDEVASSVARKFADGPTAAYRLMRRAIWAALDSTFEQSLAAERRDQKAAGTTRDHGEGVKAFLGKRSGIFTGG